MSTITVNKDAVIIRNTDNSIIKSLKKRVLKHVGKKGEIIENAGQRLVVQFGKDKFTAPKSWFFIDGVKVDAAADPIQQIKSLKKKESISDGMLLPVVKYVASLSDKNVIVGKSLSIHNRDTNKVYRAEVLYKNVGGKIISVLINYFLGMNTDEMGHIEMFPQEGRLHADMPFLGVHVIEVDKTMSLAKGGKTEGSALLSVDGSVFTVDDFIEGNEETIDEEDMVKLKLLKEGDSMLLPVHAGFAEIKRIEKDTPLYRVYFKDHRDEEVMTEEGVIKMAKYFKNYEAVDFATKEQLAKAYESVIGYDPFEDDPNISVEEVREILRAGDRRSGETEVADYFKNNPVRDKRTNLQAATAPQIDNLKDAADLLKTKGYVVTDQKGKVISMQMGGSVKVGSNDGRIKLVVVNENLLGYIIPEMPNYVYILRSSVLKGSQDPDIGSKLIGSADRVRLASEMDFEDYRVVFSKHYTPDEYEFAGSDNKLKNTVKYFKTKFQNALILYKMGDYVQLFDEDAKMASEVLGTPLVTNSKSFRYLTGFEFRYFDDYLPKLIRKGYRVALVEDVPTVGTLVSSSSRKVKE